MIEQGRSDQSEGDCDARGTPYTRGDAESSGLDTLVLSLNRIPRVSRPDTEVEGIGRVGEAAGVGGEPDTEGAAGRIRLDGVLGRGGMGVVFKGHDAELGRDLAVKILREPFRDDPEMIRRFVEEARIAGQLQHPGIVPVYEIGRLDDRRPYFAMRLVDGRTLARWLGARRHPDDDRERLLSIFESVCQTMAYAHARGVIHRDLKPSNIMVGPFGEVQVMDWGLAKVLDESSCAGAAPVAGESGRVVAAPPDAEGSDRSRPGSVLGTPAYMAPEQARGEVEALDERADVFAMGSILCEILTGRPAFTGADRPEIERRAAAGDVADAIARLSACGADAELSAMAAACLAAEATGRPRDARALADRITAYRAGVRERLRLAELARVEAQARTIGERRRRRLAVALAASISAMLLAGVVAVAWAAHRREAWRARVAVALREADLLREQAVSDPAGDPERWRAARGAALRLLDLRDVGDAPGLRDRIDAIADEVDRGTRAAERDRRLVDRLEGIREEMVRDDQAEPEFARAFADAGYDVNDTAVSPEAIGRVLAGRPRPVALAAASSLDTWAVARRYAGRADPGATRRLLAIARWADPDPRRVALRGALAAGDSSAMVLLAEDPDAEAMGPVGLWLLGHGLQMAGAHDRALGLLRRAHRRYPDDYWLNVEFGLTLLGGVRMGLGASSAWVTMLDGSDLRPREAGPYFMAAVALRPRSGYAHLLLAQAILAQGKTDESLAEFQEALRLRPVDATVHNSLGVAYQARGEPGRAAESYREAIRLWPSYALARGNLAELLVGQGRVEEGVEVFRALVRDLPGFIPAHARLASALASLGRAEEAVVAYREAIRRAPRYAAAHAGLGDALRRLGDFDGAAAAMRTAFELQPGASWQAMIRSELDRTARWAALAPRLPGVLGGADRPGGAAEALEFAYVAASRRDFVGAARLFGLAFGLEPGLADDLDRSHRYNAACCAAMAVNDRGGCVAAPDVAEARRAALRWLRADLVARSDRARGPGPAEAARLLQALGHWKIDPDLAALRHPDALARLPESDRREWLAFWGEVDAMIASRKASAGADRPAPGAGWPVVVRGFLDPSG